MKYVFRVDASLLMGTGHVMRCLTLADALRMQGGECHFICRDHSGHLAEAILQRGFAVHLLTSPGVECLSAPGDLHHSAWLGCDWQTDAQQSLDVLSAIKPDWLVIDHYALDYRWESAVSTHCGQLLAIDDLADRRHVCQIVLDQNLGRSADDYAALVPDSCTILAGPRYALLRPEFAALREYSLARRRDAGLKRILISMGGVDLPNATGRVLAALRSCELPDDCQISVVMGQTAPWLEDVRITAASLPWSTEVLVNISNMAQYMAESDVAIGAAGGTSWERCSLGLPTLMVVLAENQWPGAKALQAAQAACLIGDLDQLPQQLPLLISQLQRPRLERMIELASQICDGQGVTSLLKLIGGNHD